ncbi:hypothetical protein CBL_00452 [Carabus blaptoides fortunei]
MDDRFGVAGAEHTQNTVKLTHKKSSIWLLPVRNRARVKRGGRTGTIHCESLNEPLHLDAYFQSAKAALGLTATPNPTSQRPAPRTYSVCEDLTPQPLGQDKVIRYDVVRVLRTCFNPIRSMLRFHSPRKR